ncbi:glycosyltransferase [Chamaesiphon sp. VAR_48_metabat_135_sub]|uniref:glycosyltransferase n=1 Tax=Chamaesiphon sp. VAR_48_metabat_135_sub TaxID=2964699 RepID=UPI002869F1C2|nr:glycosyltransferase [Chamaesiphon sp. VAR_48_metabat_135_sub]
MKLGIVCDYDEEGWVSMNICAQMLHDGLLNSNSGIYPAQIRPDFHWRFKYLNSVIGKHKSFNADRFINRYWEYPRHLRSCRQNYDLFHIADHSYAHLVHSLPADRTGVFCHDIDAFRSIFEPELYTGTRSYREISKQILSGMQKAAIVFYTTNTVRQQIEKYQLVEPTRLVAAPLGVSPEYQIFPILDDPIASELTQKLQGKPYIMHVGSCIPRKRIDVLLSVFAQLRDRLPELLLVKVGGEWSQSQRQQITDLNIRENIFHITNVPNQTIAALYQQAAIVMITSELEGFGLPIIEALACGSLAIASDIPALREVGGDAVIYCPVGDIYTWVDRAHRAIITPDFAPILSSRLRQSALYSWEKHAQSVMAAYLKIAQ